MYFSEGLLKRQILSIWWKRKALRGFEFLLALDLFPDASAGVSNACQCTSFDVETFLVRVVRAAPLEVKIIEDCNRVIVINGHNSQLTFKRCRAQNT